MKAFKITIISIIILAAILIGTPIKYNCLPINIIIYVIGIVYLLYSYIKKKRKIFTSKVDIVLMVLCLSPLIPIIFDTYISLRDSILHFIQYSSCFIIYLIVKQIIQDNLQNKYAITNSLILCSVILCIIGIDEMTAQALRKLLDILNLPYFISTEHRMISSLGYANSFAIILAISIILILEQITNNKLNKKNYIYSGILFLHISCLLLTCSKGTLLFLLIAILIYIFINSSKTKTLTIFYSLMLNGILSILYNILCNSLIAKEKYIILWCVTLLVFLISILLQKLFTEIRKYIEKIPIRNIIIFIIIFVILAIIIGVKLVVPITIFTPESSKNDVKYKIPNIKPNTEYTFQFDILANSKLNNIENYTIVIEEENKYYDKVASYEITFNNYNGIKEINFLSSEETIEVAIIFKSKYKSMQAGLTVNSLFINNKRQPLKYAYLPVNLVYKIQTININHKSIWERLTFYKDSAKIIKDNMIFGIGGNGWQYIYMDIQSYNYATSQNHSYIFQVFLEYGIIGIIALFLVILLIIRKGLKNKEKYNLAEYIAFALLIIHSIIDFDMSFFYIKLIAFVLLGILAYDSKKIKYKNNNSKLLIICSVVSMFICILITILYSIYANKTNVNPYIMLELTENNKSNEIIEYIKQYQKTERYNIFNTILQYIDYKYVDEENILYIYEMIEKTPIRINVQYNIEKNNIIRQILNTSENQNIKNKFALLLIEQNNKNIEILQNKEKNRLSKEEIENYLEEQKELYMLAEKILQQ